MPGVGSRFRLDQQERALKLFRTLTAAGAIAAATIAPALAVDISGAGATFPYPLYTKWAEPTRRGRPPAELPVDRLGRRHRANHGRDRRLRRHRRADERGRAAAGAGIVHVPDRARRRGAVVYKLEPGEPQARRPDAGRHLPGQDRTLERPGNRQATTRGVTLPDQPILVAHRSDGSGTTGILTDYLARSARSGSPRSASTPPSPSR